MGKTITDIYKEYKIFPNLQMHMLRVAAVASLICDNLTIPVIKDKIIEAALLHDMGNIVKSNLKYFAEFNDEELSYWENVKKEFIQKYGAHDHMATSNILEEIGIDKSIITLTEQVQFHLWCSHKEGDDLEAKLMLYSDGRVAPNGILSYRARMDEAKKRHSQSSFEEQERELLIGCGVEVEKQIFSNCRIKPEDITDESVASRLEELKGFMVQ